jgi:hypothetical protein
MRQLREAILKNEVAFPSPTPQFQGQYRSDVQWRVAELFLIHGWTCTQLASRYGVRRGRIWLFVKSWIDRALELGYLQEIPPLYPAVAVANQAGAPTRVQDMANAPILSEEELRAVEANAKTPEDHRRIAEYYRSQVIDLQAKLQIVSCFVDCR